MVCSQNGPIPLLSTHCHHHYNVGLEGFSLNIQTGNDHWEPYREMLLRSHFYSQQSCRILRALIAKSFDISVFPALSNGSHLTLAPLQEQYFQPLSLLLAYQRCVIFKTLLPHAKALCRFFSPNRKNNFRRTRGLTFV